jgi:hypothetical protein
MPSIYKMKLHITVDQVLAGQGGDPTVLRKRSPKLIEIAQTALDNGESLLRPAVHFLQYDVLGVQHGSLELENGKRLSGELVVRHLGPAKKITVVVCTIGPDLERYTHRMSVEDPSLGLALDGLCNAAIDQLSIETCRIFEREAEANSWQCSTPISPGWDGWPAADGQPAIFKLLSSERLQVELTPSCLMLPQKSQSFVLGMGPDAFSDKSPCELCNMRESCRYKGTTHA